MNKHSKSYIYKKKILLLINHLNNLSFFGFSTIGQIRFRATFLVLIINTAMIGLLNFMDKEESAIYAIKRLSLYWILLLTFSFLVRGLFIVYVLNRVYEIKIDILKFLAI